MTTPIDEETVHNIIYLVEGEDQENPDEDEVLEEEEDEEGELFDE